jgi:predicted hydrolase (HD superfamily)
MLSRFELFVILRNQVRDKALARRALAVEAVCAALARLVGGDAVLWGLVGLGADIDVVLTAGNPARRGLVAAEILVTEGLPAEAARAASERFELEPAAMSPLARALVVADALVQVVFAAEVALEELEPAYLAHRIAKAARRGEDSAERALACLDLLGADLEAAAAAAMAALRAASEDLGR